MKTPDVDAVTSALGRVTDEEVAGFVTEETWSGLSDQLLTPSVATDLVPTPGPGGRTRGRLALAAGALVVAATVAAALAGLPGQDQPRALSVVDQGDSIIVRVADASADPHRLNREFAALGLDVRVTTRAVSPSRVGELFSVNSSRGNTDAITVLKPGEKCPATLTARDPGCQDGLEVPKNIKGRITIEFGRPAKPGEMYWLMPLSADAPGEVMHGVKFRNRTVAEVVPLVTARGQTLEYFHLSGTSPHTKIRKTVPGTWYVHDIAAVTNGSVILWVGPEKER